ncbi:heparan-alpha-glucosaminide N-acetyltransferase domain-containing protein [Janthinobacterium rivuli]|uniref:Heparan-alpha-glucosaminide N-acetyltransferase domain-containing protein n=1 Tax=Janthinobacterium rivuli TaxID=2751478 RepID=A0ABY8IDC8_9BURK|nr:heparan-alpha-glucosaminide N-acetyltransferase domain-containing protein [Janthinobacterium rivuli]WFR82027.1 heparan-alpha-glucosaminide N-acetyltransferase domain-containing protein [Janthinobacterium rivuli]
MTASLTFPATLRTRIAVIDVMRGLVMLIMLFDHVRETFFLHHQVSDPMDAAHVDPALFFTRLAAHVCAPMFVFLTGLSAWLYAHPAAGPRSATGFLFKRGLLLVVLELVFVNFAWMGTFTPAILYLQVIWVIGLAMMALAVLHKLPLKVLVVLGVAIIAGQHLFTWLHAEEGSLGYYLLTVLLQRGYLVADGAMKIKVSYPLLPWIGVIVLGYAAGPLYACGLSAEGRRRLLLALGAGSLLLLAVLRGFNLYGETLPWVAGDTALRTAMSVLNFTKYPPSLDFLLFTLGLGLLGMAWLESVDNWFTRACATFGGAPMFYYLLHLYLLLAIGITLTAVLGANHGDRYGVEHIWQVWLIALALMPVLYFPCRAFANYKRTSTQAWVRYF